MTGYRVIELVGGPLCGMRWRIDDRATRLMLVTSCPLENGKEIRRLFYQAEELTMENWQLRRFIYEGEA